jgi:hypothetical protein
VCSVVPALVTAWLGGELVERLAIGVDEGANVDAPNSLSGKPAHASGPPGPVSATARRA